MMRVEHIALQVPDPVAMADWYVRHLGFQVVRRGKGPSLAHFLGDSSGNVIIEIYNNAAASIPDYPKMNPLLLHLAFAVENITEERDRLVTAGATIADDVSTTHAGDQIAMLRDPWGFPVQLIKRLEAML